MSFVSNRFRFGNLSERRIARRRKRRLPTRRVIEHRVNDLIRDSAQSHFALAFLDVDNFKHINDYYGHAAGDLVLRTIASRIRVLLNENEIGGRIGGDEFVILARRDDEDTVRLCRKLIALVARPVIFEDRKLALLEQDETASGKTSRFSKFIDR